MTTPSNKIEQAIQMKEKLLASLQSLESKHASISIQLQQLQRDLASAWLEVDRYPEEGSAYYSRLRKDALEKAEFLSDNKKTLEQDLQIVSSQLGDIKVQLEQLTIQASVKEMLHFTEQVKQAELELNKIDEKINQQQQLIDSLNDDSEEKLDLLQEKRTQVLADISLDKAGQSDLEKLDEEINILVAQSSEQDFKNNSIERDASQLIQGLLPHKQTAQNKLDKLKASLPTVIEFFLISQAEEMAKLYIKRSKALIESYYSLKAIEEIRKETKLTTEKPFIILNAMNSLTIPSMSLKVFNDNKQDKPEKHILYAVAQKPDEKAAMLSSSQTAIKQNFEKLGLNQVFEMLNN